ARRAGRPVILVSAADQRLVQAVADHLGLFDEAHGSDGRRNLAGAEKAAFLVARYGEGGFDYAGDARGDLPVWAAARRAITVGAGARLRARAEGVAAAASAPPGALPALHVDPAPRGLRRLEAPLRALRPHQWIKNLLVLMPLIGAHSLQTQHFLALLAAAVAFSLTASAAYVFN
ncbi:MAG: prenyltransferase, partial [Pseudomonadota bacterium]